MHASKISELQRETRDAIHDFVGVIEAENANLKIQIKELVEALFPMTLFGSSLEIAMLATTCTVEKNIKGCSIFLAYCRGYVEKNINKIIELIPKSWETSHNMDSLGSREDKFLLFL
jgi:hypothetical protein